MNVQLCILNAQGVILDVNKPLIDCWKQTAEKNRIAIPDEFFESILGAGYDQRIKAFYQYPHLAALEREVLELHQKQPVSLHPKINELLDFLRSRGIKIAIVSDSRRQDILPLIDPIMKEYDISVLVCSNEVLNGKPDPNIYFKAAKLSDVKPLHTLVVDDSRNGCYAAHLAFMRSVFIMHALPLSERLFKYSYRQTDSLTDIIQIIQSENDPKVIFLFFQVQSHHFQRSVFGFYRNIDDRHFLNAFDQRIPGIDWQCAAESRIFGHDCNIFDHDCFKRTV